MQEKKLATSTTQDDPQTRRAPAEQDLADLQSENAGTSLDQPSEDVR